MDALFPFRCLPKRAALLFGNRRDRAWTGDRASKVAAIQFLADRGHVRPADAGPSQRGEGLRSEAARHYRLAMPLSRCFSWSASRHSRRILAEHRGPLCVRGRAVLLVLIACGVSPVLLREGLRERAADLKTRIGLSCIRVLTRPTRSPMAATATSPLGRRSRKFDSDLAVLREHSWSYSPRCNELISGPSRRPPCRSMPRRPCCASPP